MELLALNSASGSSTIFQPVKLIENYESLIWSERYSTNGDFELISSDVDKTMKALPLESFVTLRESTVPMVVESHRIDKPKGQHARVSVRGRSFESVLERRISVAALLPGPSQTRAAWAVSADANKQSDAAYKVMRQVLGDSVARSTLPAITLPPELSGDMIPEINLPLPTDFTTGTGTSYDVKAGNLYSVVLEFLNINHHAIRAVRPIPGSGKVTVDLEIYNGADLRSTVVFDARFDQFDAASYLLSYQGSTNVAYIYGPGGASKRQKNTGAEPTGLSRRVLLIDETSEAALGNDVARMNRGLVELYKNNAIAIFDGETSVQIGSRFNKPVEEGGYGLGDILKFNGEYGLERTVRVAEFIRTSDSTGESAYPAFQVVDE